MVGGLDSVQPVVGVPAQMGNRDHHDAIIIYPVEKRLWKPVYQASANLKPKYWPAIRVSPYVLQCNTNLVQEVSAGTQTAPVKGTSKCTT